MGLDFSKLRASGAGGALINPREIFSSLPQKATKYAYMRDVQAEVLDQWFARRDERDLVVKMNTGAGKTVVGLLALTSAVNEGAGPALYLTPDRYLAEQVLKEASQLGISAVDDPRRSEYITAKAICITTVHKLFNGKTVFGLGSDERLPIGTVLVDDAHACLDVARSQFSLEVTRGQPVFEALLNLVYPALEQQSRATAVQLKDGDTSAYMLVPPWHWAAVQEQVVELLTPLRNERWMQFHWPLVKEVLALCRVVASGDRLLISPPCLPVGSVPSFRLTKRRIYLTATLADDSILVTDFAADPASVARPLTPANASDLGDRMILSPLETHPTLDHTSLRRLLHRLASEVNVVVIAPSIARAKVWADVSTEVHTADTLAEIVARLRSGHVGVVVLVNKYDGVDLPDDACRILVIDGLPRATSLIDRVEASCLDGTDGLMKRQLQKVEQGMGRGVRSNEDHCVVVLSDARLASTIWSYGSQFFGGATAAQLDLSRQVASMLQGSDLDGLEQAIRQCLARDPDWVAASRASVATIKNSAESHVSASAVAERQAFDFAALGRFQDAVQSLRGAIEIADGAPMRGWLKQQAAAYTSLYDQTQAAELQRSAQQDNPMVLRPRSAAVSRSVLKGNRPQGEACASFLKDTYQSPQDLLLGLASLVESLRPDPAETEAFEAAMVSLAKHLGFEAQRPERELGIGPDVLWALGDLRFLVIECKSGATAAQIGKRDLAQLGHSMDWFVSAYDSTCDAAPVMVHPSREHASDGSPRPGMRILTFEKLQQICVAVEGWGMAVASTGTFSADAVLPRLGEYGLLASTFPAEWTVSPRRGR